jgi:hypothetical protein
VEFRARSKLSKIYLAVPLSDIIERHFERARSVIRLVFSRAAFFCSRLFSDVPTAMSLKMSLAANGSGVLRFGTLACKPSQRSTRRSSDERKEVGHGSIYTATHLTMTLTYSFDVTSARKGHP